MKRKKNTSICETYLPLKAKIRAPKQPIDRSKARFHGILPVFRPNCKKKPLLSRQTKEVSLMTKGCYSNKNGVIVIFRNVNSLITFGHYLMDLLTQ